NNFSGKQQERTAGIVDEHEAVHFASAARRMIGRAGSGSATDQALHPTRFGDHDVATADAFIERDELAGVIRFIVSPWKSCEVAAVNWIEQGVTRCRSYLSRFKQAWNNDGCDYEQNYPTNYCE